MLIVATGKGIKKHVNQEVYNKKTKNKAYVCPNNNWRCVSIHLFVCPLYKS